MEKDKLNDWMNNVQVTGPQALPNNKGIITVIHEPEPITTSFGERMKSKIIVEGSDHSIINVSLFLPAGFPFISPKSNLGKLMAKHDCKQLKDLIGKEVEVQEKAGNWSLVL